MNLFKEIFNPKKLIITDWCVIVWMVWSVLSAIMAPDKGVVLWGFPGWYMGMIAQVSFGWLYFLVSRFLKGGFTVTGTVFSKIIRTEEVRQYDTAAGSI